MQRTNLIGAKAVCLNEKYINYKPQLLMGTYVGIPPPPH